MKISKEKILKWIGESVLIVLSVLLAFIVEERRQTANKKEELVNMLSELSTSLRRDSIVIQVRIRYLRLADSLNAAVQVAIEKKLLAEIDALDVYNLVMNYSVKRTLNSENISLLSNRYRDELYNYNHHLEWINDHFEKIYDANCEKLNDLVYESGPAVMFEQRFKGLVKKNRDILSELIDEYGVILEDRLNLAELTKKEITLLR